MELTQPPDPFAYPIEPHLRKHGPSGYADYESYRPWLRDEFSFRCVFCLGREQWGLVQGIWDIDHFIPQSQDESLLLNYDNLLYVCRTCNLIKSRHRLPDPCRVGFGKCLMVHADGTLSALNDYGHLIVETLRLNNADHTHFRRLIIGIIQSLAKNDRTTLSMLMSYPRDLPDLSRLRPPRNSKPDGITASFHARRLRGELPETY